MIAPIQDPGIGLANLTDLFNRIRGLEVWVIGDIILDEYAVGSVDRISPEAPVPVLRVQRLEHGLGGAAHVASQAAALGAHVSLAGLIGADAAGSRVLDLCVEAKIDSRAIHRMAQRGTSRKLRALARDHQLVRLDWDDTAPCPGVEARALMEGLRNGPAPDVVILSDYAKGVLTAEVVAGVMESAGRANVPVIVGPKQRDFGCYRGASILIPNLRELEVAAGRHLDPDDPAAIVGVARSLALASGVAVIVVTLADRGLIVVPAHEAGMSVPAHRVRLSDPTGAGDTVTAVLGAAFAAGAPIDESARIANAAAGISVGRIGAVSVTPDEITACLAGHNAGKVMSLDELVVLATRWRVAGKRVVLTNGCFDLLHAGHLALLQQAAQHGDVLVVAINGDDSVRRLKGPGRPLIPAHERAAMLAALDCVSAVVAFGEDTPLDVVEAIRPDVLAKGADYTVDQVVGRECVESHGGSVVLVPLVPNKSTTALIERIASRDQA